MSNWWIALKARGREGKGWEGGRDGRDGWKGGREGWGGFSIGHLRPHLTTTYCVYRDVYREDVLERF